MTRFFQSEKVVVSHSQASFKAALVGMAVDNLSSFRIFSTPAFLALTGELAEKLKE